MSGHFVVVNDAGEYFVGYKRKVEHPDFEYRPSFGQLIEDGFSLAVVISNSRRQEVEESLRLEGIKYRIIDV